MSQLIGTTISVNANYQSDSEPIIWSLSDILESDTKQLSILGNPTFEKTSFGSALSFNGIDDGLILKENPIEGFESFTIEVLFYPSSGGNEEQRFLHVQDDSLNRGLIEIRVNSDQTWSLDTFLFDSLKNSRLTLLDRSIKHPLDAWYWVALTYDGTTMRHFVNAKQEMSGDVDFGAMGQGSISIGVRLNKVHWFRGLISEVRFYDQSLNSVELLSIE